MGTLSIAGSITIRSAERGGVAPHVTVSQHEILPCFQERSVIKAKKRLQPVRHAFELLSSQDLRLRGADHRRNGSIGSSFVLPIGTTISPISLNLRAKILHDIVKKV